MNKRKLKLVNYGISGHRYKELCGFCEQYPEWKEELRYKVDTVKSKQITDMPLSPHNNSDVTSDLVIRRIEIAKKVKLIEDTALEADSYMFPFLISHICYGASVTYLKLHDGMPMSERAFYDLRRYFFYLLDKNKK